LRQGTIAQKKSSEERHKLVRPGSSDSIAGQGPESQEGACFDTSQQLGQLHEP
jgi:hypothetical protein